MTQNDINKAQAVITSLQIMLTALDEFGNTSACVKRIKRNANEMKTDIEDLYKVIFTDSKPADVDYYTKMVDFLTMTAGFYNGLSARPNTEKQAFLMDYEGLIRKYGFVE